MACHHAAGAHPETMTTIAKCNSTALGESQRFRKLAAYLFRSWAPLAVKLYSVQNNWTNLATQAGCRS